MIESIQINNYALIDQTALAPSPGFNVITGETGAGKSILLGAIGLTLGQRADASVLNDKERKCVVEVVYDLGGYALQEWFEANELDYDKQTIIRREIAPDGKSRAFINDTPVNVKTLKELGGFIIDIHSQHQSLLLGRPEFQIEILDAFASNMDLVSVYRRKYDLRREKQAQLLLLREEINNAEKEKDYLSFQLAQLEAAGLKEGEREELEKESVLLSNTEAIKTNFHKMTYLLRDTDRAVIDTLKEVKSSIAILEDMLKEVPEYLTRLESVIIELKDLADEVERKSETVEYNPGRLEKITTRLNTIYELTYKFKVDSVAELLELQKGIAEKLDGIQTEAEHIEQLEKETEELEKEMLKLALNIREKRRGAQKELCTMMNRLLVELGIKHADFVVSLQDSDSFMNSGMDEVRFLFAANKNQQPGELSKVASGGEVSRVMLSLKYILSKSKQLPVIIFDEIDTGLSGEVAHRMAKIMQEMAVRMQVISISHLPQLASLGDTHFKVYKEDISNQTISRIKQLDREERVWEIAGMISGSDISQSALDTARSLLNTNEHN